ncbi:centrosomal protein of 162 kDa isoform X2 [Notolabrus celidotus]|uniref:centrosomal protein of 162 kDa isoform X2 n=1 Tax=Notolabrus celidotus TaxID=1203425 RepID=UPI00148FC572|nr:centrosomal protein of 162 kDa isoform X2 [Notolabrus celidotus]
MFKGRDTGCSFHSSDSLRFESLSLSVFPLSSAETTKSRFLKAKKSQPENNDVVAAEPVLKPVPKPRSKAPDTTPKETIYRTPSEDSDSLSAPAQENLQRESGERRPEETPAACREGEDGLQGSGKSFRKSQRRSQSIQEEEEDAGEEREDAASVREHTETHDSLLAPAANTNILGLDTLEEEEEKARFFSQLEAGASSSIDYSKLNKDLDSTSSADLRRAEDKEEQSEDDERKARVTETIRESPPGSPHYSEDFEEEDDIKEKKQEEVSPILAKVSLYDSLEDTGGDDRTKNTAGSLDRGQAYVQSGASEVEALHEAYRQIHVVQDLDDHHPDHEGKARDSRPASPPSPLRHAGQSLQPASTAESELPTAEELMRPIRPETDQIRGFSLQPVSTAELNKCKTPVLLEETFPDVTSPEFHVKHPAKTSQPSGSPDSPNFNLTWSIRQEVERLMKDQNKHDSPSSSKAAKSKKQQASLGSTFSRTSPSSVRKPVTAPVRGRRAEGRTAVTSRYSGTSRAATAGSKTQPAVTRPLQHPQGKTRVTKSQEEESCADPDLRVSSELVSSVQSLVSVLKQQMDSSRHTEAAETQGDTFLQDVRSSRHLQNNKREEEEEERPLLEELRVQLARRERELQAMKAEVEEVTTLRQQIFLLQSKLRSAEEVSQKKRSAEVADSAAEERQMEKEIKEQETLIKGYQQENEKLYLQMKAQQAKSKANEEAMFNENQTLLNQLAFTRDQVNKNSRPVGNVCVMDHTRRIADLLAQIDSFQRTEVKLCDHVHTLQQEKQALEVDLQLMKTERDRARTQAMSPSGDKTLELCVLEKKHREEVSALRRKLQWFAENQELLDRDAGRLKAATAEIHQLQEQVEKLKSDVSRRSGEQQRKSREKTAETKRMQDLERQVKELEQILRRRNPNSLPALIYAAATAGGPEEANTSPPHRINALLERRIQRLEAELEGHDEEAKRSLRAMEQQFHRIKLRYEQQISDLEQQLEQKHQLEAAGLKAEAEPSMSQVQILEEELQRAKETHQEKEKSLQDQMESLQQQLKQKAQQSPGRHQRQAEAAFGVRTDRLNQELAAKTRTIQELSHTVERLQKERRGMLSVRKPRPQPRPAETKKQAGPAETVGSAPAGEETFPTAQYEKTYQPTIFTGSHISEVLQENEDLKRDLELLQLQSEREKEAMMADAAQAREELCRLQETSAEQLTSLKAEHLRVLDQLRASHALEHAASKVAELTNQLHAQEMTVKHLQDQLRELHGAKDALVISRTREDALQKQLTRLLQELKDAKEAQSPEVKLMCNLERKIFNMELRHQHREKELQQVIGSSWQTLDSDQLSEVERWKRLAQDKSREVEAFRLELDSILDILRHLQRQGVVLTPISTITAPRSTQR